MSEKTVTSIEWIDESTVVLGFDDGQFYKYSGVYMSSCDFGTPVDSNEVVLTYAHIIT